MYEICNMNLHMQIMYQWGGGGQGCRQLLKRETLPGFWAVQGLDIQYRDDSGHLLRMPVLCSFYYVLDFPAGKRLTN